MKKELRSKGYHAAGTAISIIGFLLSAVAGITCAYIFEFFSFEGCPDETNIILGIIVFVVCEFSVITKRKILSGIQDALELGEELESKLELMSGVEIISDGMEEDKATEPEYKKEKKSLLGKGKKADKKEEHVHALLREERSDEPIVQSAPIPPVQKPVPPTPAAPKRSAADPVVQKAPEPVVSPIRSASDPVVQKAPEPVVAPIRSASDPVVQRAPEPVVAPIRSASEPVVQRAPEPVVAPIRSASEPVVQRAPEPVVTPKQVVEPEPVKEAAEEPKKEDVFELMFEEATDDML